MNLLTALAANQAANSQSTGSTLLMYTVPLLIFVLFFYLFIIRPQKKQEKEEKNMLDNTAIGDEVVTIGGIIGIVLRDSGDTFVIETGGDKSKIRIRKSAVKENITAAERRQAEISKEKSAKLATAGLVNDDKKDKKKNKDK